MRTSGQKQLLLKIASYEIPTDYVTMSYRNGKALRK